MRGRHGDGGGGGVRASAEQAADRRLGGETVAAARQDLLRQVSARSAHHALSRVECDHLFCSLILFWRYWQPVSQPGGTRGMNLHCSRHSFPRRAMLQLPRG